MDDSARDVAQIGVGDVTLNVGIASERDKSFWSRVQSGGWEPHTIEAMNRCVSSGSTYIDIGAWIGPTVLYAAALGAEVHAYEPDPEALVQLRANIARNPDLATRITVHEVALAGVTGTARLASKELGDSMASLVRGDAPTAATVQVVDARAEVGREHFLRADVLKLDVEGGEYAVVPRILPYLQSHRPTVILSTHPHRLRSKYGHLPRGLKRAAIIREQARLLPLRFYDWEAPVGDRSWSAMSGSEVLKALWTRAGAEFLLT